MNSSRKKTIALLLTLIVAGLLRIAALLKYGDFWNDEMFSFVYSQKSWWDSITKYWVWETNPPLHMILLKLWFYIFPPSELTARLPSLFLGLGSIAALYGFSKKIFGQAVAILAAAMFAFSPIHILHSVTARTYMLLILLAILSTHYFYKIFFEKEKTARNIILYSFFNLLMLYCHFSAWGVLAVQLAALAAFDRKNIKTNIACLIMPALLWFIWAIPSLYVKLQPPTFGNTWFSNIDASFTNVIQMLQLIFTGPTSWVYGLIIMSALLIGVGIIFYRLSRQHNHNLPLLFIFIAAVVSLSGVLLLKLVNTRFLLFALPWTTLLMAFTANYFLKSKLQFLALILFIPGLVTLWNYLPLVNWNPAVQYIQQNLDPAKKQTFIYDEFTYKNALERYLNLPMPMVAYLPEENYDWDCYYITKNYVHREYAKDADEKWMERQKIADYDEIFLLRDANPDTRVDELLKNNGWKIIDETLKVKAVNDLVVLRMTKIK